MYFPNRTGNHLSGIQYGFYRSGGFLPVFLLLPVQFLLAGKYLYLGFDTPGIDFLPGIDNQIDAFSQFTDIRKQDFNTIQLRFRFIGVNIEFERIITLLSAFVRKVASISVIIF